MIVSYKAPTKSVDMPDLVPGIIKQRAFFDDLYHKHSAQSVVIKCNVYRYAATPTGDYGQDLSLLGFPPEEITMTADNDSIVNGLGVVVATRNRTGENPSIWDAKLKQYNDLPENYYLQGDFFCMLRDNAAISIGELIRQHMANKFASTV